MSDRETQEEIHIESIKSKLGYVEFVAMIAAMMAINSFAIDIMLPALESIKDSYHVVGENEQHYIIFSYLIGFGFSQIAVGPISDRFGRRRPILIGLAIYAIASLLCTMTPSFGLLLLLRFIQGMGGAATRSLTISIVRDLYDGRKMAEVMSIAIMVFLIAPIIAPATGQGLLFFGPWKIIFIFMTFAGVVTAIWVYYRLPETLYKQRALTFHTISIGLATVLSNRIALCYTLAFSVILGGLFSSLNTAEQIYNDVYGLGTLFPLAFAAVAAFQSLAAFLNSRFVVRFGMRHISHTFLIIFTVASFIWLVWSLLDNGIVPFSVYMTLFIIIMFSFGAIGANFNTLAMEPLGKIAGTASSVFGFLQTVIGASIGLFIGLQFNGTITPIALGFCVLSLLAIILVLIAERGKLFQSQHNSILVTTLDTVGSEQSRKS